MANAKISGDNCEYAIVDTQPGASGYFTNEVQPRKDGKLKGLGGKIFFSIRESNLDDSSDAPASVITVTLQFKCNRDLEWQDYVSDLTIGIGARVAIEDCGTGVVWRAGVKEASDYTSGSLTFGFDW